MNALIDYVRRTLVYLDEKGGLERIDDLSLMNVAEPVIVLGEPGMGKTRLLQQIAKDAGWISCSAARFVDHPNPARFVSEGAKLVIDGLDELSAAKESDPVCRVLKQLINAGCPPFILSCRAADWRGAVARQDISEEYGVSPREMTLEPFSREGAVKSLDAALGPERAEEVVTYLEEQGIPELYGNPLTLNLFAKVAADGRPLPETRAELMLRAAEIMWNERNDRHDKSPLSNLDQATALAAAGVASAAFILTGSEAISLKPSSVDLPHIIQAAELRSLPGGQEARILVGSRLFSAVPDAPDQFKPIHRSVAEFLGARWLSRSVRDEQMRERVLAMMTIDGGVPASLRGIHAWLAQDHRFAEAVIATDPYGVLRYGDADGLSVTQGRQLLHALKKLQQTNPDFRSEDWGHHSAKGLTHLELLEDVRALLFASDTGAHLRTLLLEAIRGSKLATALVDDLLGIVLQKDGQMLSYAERQDAALAVSALGQEAADWPVMIERLNRMGDEDSTRLALEMLDEIGFEQFTAESVARAILARLGLLEDKDADEIEHDSSGALHMVARHIPDALVSPVLDVLATYHQSVGGANSSFHIRSNLSDVVIRLVARQLKIAVPEPLRLFKWLKLTQRQHSYSNDDRNRVSAFLQDADEFRRAIQYQVLFCERDHDRPLIRIWRLSDISQGLSLSTDDVIYFLRRLEASEDRGDELTEIWRELSAFAHQPNYRANDIIKAARSFIRNNAEQDAYLAALSKPPPEPKWKIEQEKRGKHEQKKRDEEWARHREIFRKNEEALRAGELKFVCSISKVYLGSFNDLERGLSPPDRIGRWLGSDLQAAALAGFEAVLTRTDLPTLQQIADSYAEPERWNFVGPMVVGVVERIRTGRGLDDVSLDTVVAVRIALQNEHFDESVVGEKFLSQLDAFLRRDPVVYAHYVRLMIEPSLERQMPRIKGLYRFVRDPVDRELCRQFAIEWLERYPKMPLDIEIELIDVVADAEQYQVLRKISHQRSEQGHISEDRRRNWLAVDLIVDFEAASSRIGNIAVEERDFLWNLRHRLRGDGLDKRPMPNITATALAWIVRQFRPLWPNQTRPSRVFTGETNRWDATDFLLFLVNRLERDPSEEAVSELAKLVSAPEDDYTQVLRQSVYQQGCTLREILFQGVTLDHLKNVVESRPPETADDLLAVIRYTLKRLQKELRGNDTDSVRAYWRDDGEPRVEDHCTDALIDDIQRLLPPYGIGRTPQADMPNNKRADIIYTVGNVVLPIECKGQWNKELWSAASDQLDALYLRDWRTEDRGIYLVYWFGPNVASNCRLKPLPDGAVRPTTPEELRQKLIDCLAPARRGSIFIEVLDLTR